jgi:transcriptional regulator with XRE-family HTH domain
MQALGEQLLLLRRRAGLSQSALAQSAGVDTMTISRIESGQKKRLELETAARLARVFGTTLDQLCGLDGVAPLEVIAPSRAQACQEPAPPLGQRQWSDDELAAQILGWHEDEGMSLQAIVQRLNTAHIPTRSGRGQWYQASVSELLRQRIPTGKAARKAFLARYMPERHAAEDPTAPPPPAKRPRPRKAAPVR